MIWYRKIKTGGLSYPMNSSQPDNGNRTGASSCLGKGMRGSLLKAKSILQSRLYEINEKGYQTSSEFYGKGNHIEKFRLTDFNIVKNPELRPCDRRSKKKR